MYLNFPTERWTRSNPLAQVFKERFRNRRNYLKRKANRPLTAPVIAGLISNRAPTGYNKFTKANSKEVSDQLKGDEDKPRQVKAGTYQTIMGGRWQELTKEEKDRWNDLAAKDAVERDPKDIVK